MSRLILAVLLGAAVPLWAQETPQVTLSAGWTFQSQDQVKGTFWTTGETAWTSLRARWSNALDLGGTLKTDFSGTPLNADDLIDQLSLTWTANDFTIVTVGKQRLSWGTARVFSAIDSLEPPLDPADLQTKPRGVTGAKVELIPLDWLSVWALALPAARLDDSLVAAKLDLMVGEADVTFGVARSISRPLTGWNGTTASRDRRESPVFFADVARFFDRFGVYGEAQVRQGRHRDWALGPVWAPLNRDMPWTLRATGGVQIEVPVWLRGTLRWLTEYQYNGEGFDEAEAEAFALAWPQRTSTSVMPSGLTVGAYRRHYAYTGISGLPLVENITLSTSALVGWEGLVMSSASVDWKVSSALSARCAFDRFDSWTGPSDRTELLFLPWRNRVSASVTAWY